MHNSPFLQGCTDFSLNFLFVHKAAPKLLAKFYNVYRIEPSFVQIAIISRYKCIIGATGSRRTYSSCYILDYNSVTSGSTCKRITSKVECEEASRHLDLSDNVASGETESDYPPYCYFYRGNGVVELWFNDNGNSESSCTSEYVCICKNGEVECQ